VTGLERFVQSDALLVKGVDVGEGCGCGFGSNFLRVSQFHAIF
jgi:hypothetical protein